MAHASARRSPLTCPTPLGARGPFIKCHIVPLVLHRSCTDSSYVPYFTRSIYFMVEILYFLIPCTHFV